MPGTNVFSSPQWRDANRRKSYPFTDSSSLTTDTEKSLGDGSFVDARIYIPGVVGIVSLLRIVVEQDTLTIAVGTQGDSDTEATGVIDLSRSTPIVALLSSAGRVVGTLLPGSDSFADILLLGYGEHIFPAGSADFVPAVVNYVPITTSRLLGPEGEELGDTIRLVGEEGVRLTCEPGVDSTTVLVHSTGDPLYQLTTCDVDAASANQVIQRIVFQSGDTTIECEPGDTGIILIVPDTFDKVDSALRVTPEADGLRFALAGKSLEA